VRSLCRGGGGGDGGGDCVYVTDGTRRALRIDTRIYIWCNKNDRLCARAVADVNITTLYIIQVYNIKLTKKYRSTHVVPYIVCREV